MLVVYTSSPPVPFEPPVAKPDTLNVIFPEFSYGDMQVMFAKAKDTVDLFSSSHYKMTYPMVKLF